MNTEIDRQFHAIDKAIRRKLNLVMILMRLAAKRPHGSMTHQLLAWATDSLGEALQKHYELREENPLRAGYYPYS